MVKMSNLCIVFAMPVDKTSSKPYNSIQLVYQWFSKKIQSLNGINEMTNNLSTAAYDYIIDAIRIGKLEIGSTISEHSLAKDMKISRTPVREAVRRLKFEGVVEQIPRFGTIVRSPDQDELRELYELREALECFAVERAAEKVTAEDIAELKELTGKIKQMAHEFRKNDREFLNGKELKEFLDIDMSFHMRLIQISGNCQIMKSVRESKVLTGIFSTPRQKHSLNTLAMAYRRHSQILQALEKKDKDKARNHLERHIRASCDKALAHYAKERSKSFNKSAF
jgi:DNA-binding GntR family transcriptional regulator